MRLRHTIITHKELAAKLSELERKVVSHDGHIKSLFDAIRQLMLLVRQKAISPLIGSA